MANQNIEPSHTPGSATQSDIGEELLRMLEEERQREIEALARNVGVLVDIETLGDQKNG